MNENEEELLLYHYKNEFFRAKTDEIRVVIFEQQIQFLHLGLQNIYLFLHKIPDAEHNGGIITARSLSTGLDKRKTYDSYETLNRAFIWIKNDTLKKDKTIKPIYQGAILRG